MTYEASRIVYKSRDDLAESARRVLLAAFKPLICRYSGGSTELIVESRCDLEVWLTDAINQEFDRLADRLEKEVAEMLEWNANPANPGSYMHEAQEIHEEEEEDLA